MAGEFFCVEIGSDDAHPLEAGRSPMSLAFSLPPSVPSLVIGDEGIHLGHPSAI